jgi:hypothetical protein
MVSKRLAEGFVEVEGDNGFGELVQVATEDVCCVVDCVPSPVEAFSIALCRIKNLLELFDASRRAAQTKDALDLGGCRS